MLTDQSPAIQNLKNDPHDLSVLAIESLDALLSQLIRDGDAYVSSQFLDWVADSLTITILSRLEAAQATIRFQETMKLGDSKVAMMHWVKKWSDKFEQ
jgi:hypothetical protein